MVKALGSSPSTKKQSYSNRNFLLISDKSVMEAHIYNPSYSEQEYCLKAKCQWLTPAMLATQETENRRIKV
jgi:hypothetical protein